MRKSIMLAVAGATLVAGSAFAAQNHAAAPRKAVPDLADTVAGTYHGDVISDSRGSSQSHVMVTVTKSAPNTVSVVSSRRLPTFTVRLTRAMQTIQQASGDNVFLVDTSKSPWSLDVTVDGASWSGSKN